MASKTGGDIIYPGNEELPLEKESVDGGTETESRCMALEQTAKSSHDDVGANAAETEIEKDSIASSSVFALENMKIHYDNENADKQEARVKSVPDVERGCDSPEEAATGGSNSCPEMSAGSNTAHYDNETQTEMDSDTQNEEANMLSRGAEVEGAITEPEEAATAGNNPYSQTSAGSETARSDIETLTETDNKNQNEVASISSEQVQAEGSEIECKSATAEHGEAVTGGNNSCPQMSTGSETANSDNEMLTETDNKNQNGVTSISSSRASGGNNSCPQTSAGSDTAHSETEMQTEIDSKKQNEVPVANMPPEGTETEHASAQLEEVATVGNNSYPQMSAGSEAAQPDGETVTETDGKNLNEVGNMSGGEVEGASTEPEEVATVGNNSCSQISAGSETAHSDSESLTETDNSYKNQNVGSISSAQVQAEVAETECKSASAEPGEAAKGGNDSCPQTSAGSAAAHSDNEMVTEIDNRNQNEVASVSSAQVQAEGAEIKCESASAESGEAATGGNNSCPQTSAGSDTAHSEMETQTEIDSKKQNEVPVANMPPEGTETEHASAQLEEVATVGNNSNPQTSTGSETAHSDNETLTETDSKNQNAASVSSVQMQAEVAEAECKSVSDEPGEAATVGNNSCPQAAGSEAAHSEDETVTEIDKGNQNEVVNVSSAQVQAEGAGNEHESAIAEPGEGATGGNNSSPQTLAGSDTALPDNEKLAERDSKFKNQNETESISSAQGATYKPVRTSASSFNKFSSSYGFWGDRDTQRYRAGYPDKIDDPELSSNLEFYGGKIQCEPHGDYIDNIHKNWWDNYDLLESHHGYIQWLFPIREPGLNWHAQELQLHEAKKIAVDEVMMHRFLRSYEMMLNFYGIKLVSRSTGEVQRAENWRERFKFLNHSMHNYLRITRILKCLGEMGLEHFKSPFLLLMLREAIETGHLRNTLKSCWSYWIGTVKDDDERAGLYQYAQNLDTDHCPRSNEQCWI